MVVESREASIFTGLHSYVSYVLDTLQGAAMDVDHITMKISTVDLPQLGAFWNLGSSAPTITGDSALKNYIKLASSPLVILLASFEQRADQVCLFVSPYLVF